MDLALRWKLLTLLILLTLLTWFTLLLLTRFTLLTWLTLFTLLILFKLLYTPLTVAYCYCSHWNGLMSC